MPPENINNQNITSASSSTSVKSWMAWVVLLIVSAVAVFEWGSVLKWDANNLNLYVVFPLLGLLAWSTMWTHYFLAFASKLNNGFKMSKLYKRVTAYMVLILILAHPGLLALAQWQSLGQFPPSSYLSYVGDSMILAIIAAEIALLSFLAFEVLIRFKNHPLIKRLWLGVSISQMVAILLIFGHSLTLGSNLQAGWFKYYWIALGILLIPSFFVVGRDDIRHARRDVNNDSM